MHCKRWFLNIIIFIISAAGAFGFLTFLERPRYSASVTIAIDAPTAAVLETQKAVIKSRRSAYHVFKKLKLSRREEFIKAEDPLKALLEKIELERIGDSQMFKLTVTDASPKLAGYIASEFARGYAGPQIIRPQVKLARSIKKRNIVWALIIGFIGVNAALFLRPKRDVSLAAGGDNLISSLGLGFLGSVPKADSVFRNDLDPFISEAYRLIRTNLLFHFKDSILKTQSIVITSSLPREGKTATALNLAIMMANSGEKTLLVDANVKRPAIHRMFNKDNEAGFLNFISQGKEFGSIIKDTGVHNLGFVAPGGISKGLTRLLFTKGIEKFLQMANTRFSKIIFDSPAVTSSADARELSRLCTGTVLVVERGKASAGVLRRSKMILEKAGARIIGGIFNKEEVFI